MNRELLVTLIRKNIDELIMLTEGFMEMNTYPAAIINLAKNKTDDIWSYINQLGNLKPEELQQAIEKIPVIPDMSAKIEKEETVEIEVTENKDVVTEEEENMNSFDEEELSKEEEEDDDDIIFENEEKAAEDEEEPESVAHARIIDENKNNIEITEDVITVEFIETTEKEQTTVTDTEKMITTTETIEKKITLAEKIASSGTSRNEVLARGESGGINAAIGNKKVDDIRQAISLGDRFRFQRELFRNNGEEMNKILSYINKLATYEEVTDFLQSKYNWDEGNAAVEDFYQIIKRKF